MSRISTKLANKTRRAERVRRTVIGTADRPRLSVTISNRHVSAQVIDDATGKTLVSSTTVNAKKTGTLSEQAAWIGEDIAKKAVKAKIKQVVLDRNGRAYQMRLNALATAARENGLEF